MGTHTKKFNHSTVSQSNSWNVLNMSNILMSSFTAAAHFLSEGKLNMMNVEERIAMLDADTHVGNQ